jgi:hypothetical protein
MPSGEKNEHKMFATTLGKLARALVIEGQQICNGWAPKAGIGEIVNFFFTFKNCDFFFILVVVQKPFWF